MVGCLGPIAILAMLPALASIVGQAQGAANRPSKPGKHQPEDVITYTLGPGDEVVVSVSDAAEIQELFANSFQIQSDGYLTPPMVGSESDASSSQVAVSILRQMFASSSCFCSSSNLTAWEKTHKVLRC
jgi:protein involved in polysaccharide export with SLBB domain